MTTRAVKPGQLITSQGDDGPEEERDIPIQMILPGITLNFLNDWHTDRTELENAKSKHNELMARIEILEKENHILREKYEMISNESNLDKFKSQLLVEMLAISSLDEEKCKEEYLKEKHKVESLKQDMKRVLEIAASQKLDIKQFAVLLKGL